MDRREALIVLIAVFLVEFIFIVFIRLSALIGFDIENKAWLGKVVYQPVCFQKKATVGWVGRLLSCSAIGLVQL